MAMEKLRRIFPTPRQSCLRLRLSDADIPQVLPLAGKGLEVVGHRIRLGVPQIHSLSPMASLIARTVTFKNATETDQFLKTARQKLDELQIGGNPNCLNTSTRRGTRKAFGVWCGSKT